MTTADKQKTIVWLRLDLRTIDNPALFEPLERGDDVIPLFIYAPEEEQEWAEGGAAKVWLHESLLSLKEDLRELGLALVIKKGNSLQVLEKIAKEANVTSIHWNRRYEPAIILRDKEIKAKLSTMGYKVTSHNSALLFEPWTVANKQGKPYQVFTPFWKACREREELTKPLPKPKKTDHSVSTSIQSLSVEDLHLLPKIHWDKGIHASWKFGMHNAIQRAKHFIDQSILDYPDLRDFPGEEGVSKLSPHLHFGEISPRMIWHMVREKHGHNPKAEEYLKQLGWREFGHHLLYHFPHTPNHPLRKEFNAFPWLDDKEALKRWQKGVTGYPIVDAGMRQLWHTGWMHNRVRMIVGSFLVKDLLLSWTEGAKWFWDTLVDADLANNTLGWQWVGGCGADAAPYFRVFNPVTQGEKFDENGDYVKQWVPELALLSHEWIHKPWQAPPNVLEKAGVRLGETYPLPIVDHNKARERALAAFERVKTN